MISKKISTLVLTSVLLTSSVSVPAYAATGDFRETLKERIASMPGFLKTLNSGRVAIGTGEITAISGTTMTVTREGTAYTVQTDSNTKFRRKFWGVSELSEFSVGDKINVIGKWQDDAKTTILARMVRDLSIQMRHGVFFGTVKSVSGSTLTVDTVKRATQTVTVSSDTKYINRREQPISLSDIQVGHKIRVRGLWNSKNSTITEVKEVKDFSLPPVGSPSASTTTQ